MTTAESTQTNESKQNTTQFGIQRIYVKHAAFDIQDAPMVFKNIKEWKPQVNFEMRVNNKKTEENIYEVELNIKVKTKIEEKVIYEAEVSQCGIFTIQNIESKAPNHLLGAYCPGILFPYVRKVLDGMVVDGGFPALQLAPINFDALYAKQLAEQKAKEKQEQKEELDVVH